VKFYNIIFGKPRKQHFYSRNEHSRNQYSRNSNGIFENNSRKIYKFSHMVAKIPC